MQGRAPRLLRERLHRRAQTKLAGKASRTAKTADREAGFPDGLRRNLLQESDLRNAVKDGIRVAFRWAFSSVGGRTQSAAVSASCRAGEARAIHRTTKEIQRGEDLGLRRGGPPEAG